MAAIEVTEQNFEVEVLRAAQPVLVDFWGDDCAGAQAVAPIMDRLAGEWIDQVKVVKMWLTPDMPTVSRLGLMNIPTLILFQQGVPVARMLNTPSSPLNHSTIVAQFRPYLENV